MKIKNLLFRAGMGLGTLGIIVGGAAAFSAFEAHVVNVTATIENALTVPVEQSGLTFGDMFPEEVATTTLPISLSSSFMSTDRVDDVEYMIRQKPKCGIPVTLDVASGTPVSYSGFTQVTEDSDGNFVCPEGSVELPLLCPYLSKHEENPDGSDSSNGIDAFHGLPGPWTEATTENTEVTGVLSKQQGKTSTNWDIDLHTPCFKGECAQDWASFVTNTNPSVADPTIYEADPAQEHQMFGCDLWVEVTNISLPTTTTDGLLTVTKIVVGTSTPASSFSLFVDNNPVTTGVATTTSAGAHVVSEGSYIGYNSVIGGPNCDSNGNVTVSTSTPAFCTITNTWIQPIPTLTIVKNTTGGDGTFNFTVSGASSSSPSVLTTGGTGTTGPINVGAGTYTVTETVPSGWQFGSANCNDGSSATTTNGVSGINIAPGSNITCTFNDSVPGGTLTVIKNVVNTGGGTATANQFTINIPAGTPNSVTGNASGTPVNIPGNTSYTVTEATSGPANYVAGYSSGCSSTMTPGGSATCIVTNTWQYGMITINKIIDNTGGGTATTSSFMYYVGSTQVQNGVVNDFAPGAYTVSEGGLPGYQAAFSGDCSGSGQINLSAGQNLTCTIKNTVIPPSITLKTVVSNGSATVSDFGLFIDSVFVASGSSRQVTANASHSITVTEDTAASGYNNTVTGTSAYSVSCPSSLPGNLTLAPGDSIVCTVTETHP